MSTVSAASAYSSLYSLLKLKTEQNGTDTASTASAGEKNATTSVSNLLLASGDTSSEITSQISSMVELIKMAMQDMGTGSGGRVTFSQLQKYSEDMKSDYETALKSKMEEAGLDPEMSFRIQAGSDGEIRIISNDENAEKLQALFDANPDLGKQYRKLEALSGIESARKALQIPMNELRTQIQMESVATWWLQSGNAAGTPQFGDYNAGVMNVLSGINTRV